MIMYTIEAHTKISILLQHPKALEVIIGISPKFEKLRNPILRRLMAKRTTVKMASKMAGCSVHDFFDAFQAIGFAVVDNAADENELNSEIPKWVKDIDFSDLVDLDVRPVLASGKDPLKLILSTVDRLKGGQVLRVTNTFEPLPLIALLARKGWDSYTDHVAEDLVHTFFCASSGNKETHAENRTLTSDWEGVLAEYRDRLKEIDVRGLEPPQPMLRILEALEDLDEGQALYVHHERIPVFLFPELKEDGWSYAIKEKDNGEVYLIIYRP